MSNILGIDFGAFNSCVAVLRGVTPTVLENAEGERLTPSVVAFDHNGRCLVGAPAKRQAALNPRNTFFSLKQLLGLRFEEARRYFPSLPFEITAGANGELVIQANVGPQKRAFSAQELCAFFLRKLKTDAERRAGHAFPEAVIGVPSSFSENQRTALRDAAAMAGLRVVRFASESVLAALAVPSAADQKILVCDAGASRVEIAVLEIGDGVYEVKSVCSEPTLGGECWNLCLLDWALTSFKMETGIDLSSQAEPRLRVLMEIQSAIAALASVEESAIKAPSIAIRNNAPVHLCYHLNRSRLASITRELFEGLARFVQARIRESSLEPSAINQTYLVGGLSRTPGVAQAIIKAFGKEPSRALHADEAVARGAAIQAGIRAGAVKDILLLDVVGASIGIETLGGVATRLIERNTTFPTRRSEIFSTASDNQPGVEIHVIQGERELARDNQTLGKFQLVDIPPAPRGAPQIEVTFDIDANGEFHVEARDLTTGKEQRVVVTRSTGISPEALERGRRQVEELLVP